MRQNAKLLVQVPFGILLAIESMAEINLQTQGSKQFEEALVQ